jgi:hypothetical protein
MGMLSLAVRRRGRRSTVAVLCALVALGLVFAGNASAAVRSNALVNVSGTHSFGTLGVFAISGRASITSMQLPNDPCSIFNPIDPCRVITIATVARATDGVNTCSYTGATTVTVPVADTTTVDAVVIPGNPIVPPNPVLPPNPVCPQLGSFAVRYNLAISADNTITSVGVQTEPVT